MFGALWEVLPTIEFLLNHLERYKTIYEHEPESFHLKVNINLAWDKLNEYYSKLDHPPAYLAALALHPRYKLRWIKKHWANRADWIKDGETAVKRLWEAEYKNKPLSNE